MDLDPALLFAIVFTAAAVIAANDAAIGAAPSGAGGALNGRLALILASAIGAAPLLLLTFDGANDAFGIQTLARLLPADGAAALGIIAVGIGVTAVMTAVGRPFPALLGIAAAGLGAALASETGLAVDSLIWLAAGLVAAVLIAPAVGLLADRSFGRRVAASQRPRDAARRALPLAMGTAAGVAVAACLMASLRPWPQGPVLASVAGVLAGLLIGLFVREAVGRSPFFTSNDPAGADAAFRRPAVMVGLALSWTTVGFQAAFVAALLLPVATTGGVGAGDWAVASAAAAIGILAGGSALGSPVLRAAASAWGAPSALRATAAGTGAVAAIAVAAAWNLPLLGAVAITAAGLAIGGGNRRSAGLTALGWLGGVAVAAAGGAVVVMVGG